MMDSTSTDNNNKLWKRYKYIYFLILFEETRE